jgi:hypothetical protein
MDVVNLNEISVESLQCIAKKSSTKSSSDSTASTNSLHYSTTEDSTDELDHSNAKSSGVTTPNEQQQEQEHLSASTSLLPLGPPTPNLESLNSSKIGGYNGGSNSSSSSSSSTSSTTSSSNNPIGTSLAASSTNSGASKYEHQPKKYIFILDAFVNGFVQLKLCANKIDYEYIIEVYWSNENKSFIKRTYQDFFNFHEILTVTFGEFFRNHAAASAATVNGSSAASCGLSNSKSRASLLSGRMDFTKNVFSTSNHHNATGSSSASPANEIANSRSCKKLFGGFLSENAQLPVLPGNIFFYTTYRVFEKILLRFSAF